MVAIAPCEVTVEKLCLHRLLDLRVPAPFHLDEDLHRVIARTPRVLCHSVDAEVDAAYALHSHLAANHNATTFQITFKVVLKEVG